MHLPIGSVSDLGLVIRAIRKHGKVRIDDLAASAGVSKQYVMDLEYGKPTIRMGLAFKVMEELGITGRRSQRARRPLALRLPRGVAERPCCVRPVARSGFPPSPSRCHATQVCRVEVTELY